MEKTLNLDVNLHRPTTLYAFEVANHRGLSTAVVNDHKLNNW